MDIKLIRERFAEGIGRWCNSGWNVPDALFHALAISPAVDLYDGNFRNELTGNLDNPDEVAAVLGIEIDAANVPSAGAYTYQLKELKTFTNAAAFRDYCPTWCIVNSEDAFNEHTSNGQRFFVAIRNDYASVASIPGINTPYDNYGYSIIGIGISGGNLTSVTSRWNSQSEADDFLSLADLKELLGDMLDNIMSLLP